MTTQTKCLALAWCGEWAQSQRLRQRHIFHDIQLGIVHARAVASLALHTRKHALTKRRIARVMTSAARGILWLCRQSAMGLFVRAAGPNRHLFGVTRTTTGRPQVVVDFGRSWKADAQAQHAYEERGTHDSPIARSAQMIKAFWSN